MPRTRKNQMKVCSVTGLETSVNNFYKNQNHVKAVDNLRRTTNATKEQLQLECLTKLINTHNMAGIIKGSINLAEIPKDKIIDGKKGKYLPISITLTMKSISSVTSVQS